MYTVKQLSEIARVSVRTLHYYDEIGLLPPSKIGANRYRYYDDAALFRLQQILFYREIGLELLQIKEILDSPDFNIPAALVSHRAVLQEKIDRLQNLIHTVDSTIKHLGGELNMSKKQLFEAFSEEKQKYYTRLARLEYGPELVNESVRRWNGYTSSQQDAILEEAGEIYTDIAAAIDAGLSARSPEVQAMLERWHANLEYFYTPTLDVLRGLGELYNTNPEFMAKFNAIHPRLSAYLQEGINAYVDHLEHVELERLIAEDDEADQME